MSDKEYKHGEDKMTKEEFMAKAREQMKELGGEKIQMTIYTNAKAKQQIEERRDDHVGVEIFLSRVFNGMNWITNKFGPDQAEEVGTLILALVEGEFDGAIVLAREVCEDCMGDENGSNKKVTVH